MVGVAVAVFFASLLLGYAAWSLRPVMVEKLPMLVAFAGISTTGVLATLITAWAVSDYGKVWESILTVLFFISRILLDTLGFWVWLGIAGRVFTAASLVWELIIAGAFIGWAVYELIHARCI